MICYNQNINIIKTKKGNMPSITVDFKKSSHDIDVDTYIATLRSLSIIAKEVNYKINNRTDIQLNIVAQKEGSFEAVVEFICTAGPIAIQTTQEILSTINTIIELYKIKKTLRDTSDAKVVQQEDNKVQVINNFGSMIVNQPTYVIYNENQTVQDALASTFSKTSKDDSVDGLVFNSSSNDSVEVDRSEFEPLSRKMTVQSKDAEDEVVPATLVVVKPVLDKSNNKWTFFKGTEKIQADIQDSDFLDAVANGKCSFTAGDRLMVELRIQNRYDEQFRMYIPKKYSVLKVKDHITGDEAVQMDMLQ
jgi:hypothetical protein